MRSAISSLSQRYRLTLGSAIPTNRLLNITDPRGFAVVANFVVLDRPAT